MPTTIPYAPRLVFGNIIEKETIDHLVQIADTQKPMADAQAKPNSLILQKRSLDMTM